MKYVKFILLCLLQVILLSGCGSQLKAVKKISQVIMDPDIEIGEKKTQPSTVRLSFLADQDINPNLSGKATPLQIQVIYLKEDSNLLNLAFDEIINGDIQKILGKNYLDHQEYTLVPGQFKTIDEQNLYKENHYIAVIGFYADDTNSEWRKIITASGIGEEYKFLIHAKNNQIDIRQDGDEPEIIEQINQLEPIDESNELGNEYFSESNDEIEQISESNGVEGINEEVIQDNRVNLEKISNPVKKTEEYYLNEQVDMRPSLSNGIDQISDNQKVILDMEQQLLSRKIELPSLL